MYASLDFTQIGAGPLAGMQMGDMGAEVIKVEAPSGDIGRKLGPPWQKRRVSGVDVFQSQ